LFFGKEESSARKSNKTLQIGFTPNGSQFSLALHWAQYLSLYAYNSRGRPGTKVPFPGVKAAYHAQMTPVSASTLAQFAIYASVHPEECGDGRLFNVGDAAESTTFANLWPRLAEWFGLVGVGPSPESSESVDRQGGGNPGEMLMPGEYIAKHRGIFGELGLERAEKAGVSAGASQLDSIGTWLTFDRQLSLERLKASGFTEERDPVRGWLESFEAFRRAGLIL
jgi:hypothetical protein